MKKPVILLLTIITAALLLGCVGEKPAEKTPTASQQTDRTDQIESGSEDLEIASLDLEIQELETLINETDMSDTIDIGEINLP